MKIHEQITKETWVKGRGHRGDARCLHMWCCVVYGYEYVDALSSLHRALDSLPGHANQGVVEFNDAPETTFEDILRLCKLADV